MNNKIYMAPLEGITGFVFRNAFEKYYGGVDKYFTPFITPHTKKSMDAREKRDILPENNPNIFLVPQVLTNKSEELIQISKDLKQFGYDEININIGCPSKTVTSKRKGAGFLQDVKLIDRMLEEFFSVSEVALSVKTRIGFEDEEEFPRILEVYNKYPLKELIIHPRLATDYYNGTIRRNVFEYACKQSGNTLCYNGDITTLDDYKEKSQFDCNHFMIGRGLIVNPNIVREIINGQKKDFDIDIFYGFHNAIIDGYESYLSGDKNVLFRMKELWGFWARLPFSKEINMEKKLKQIKKTDTLKEYRLFVEDIIKSQSAV